MGAGLCQTLWHDTGIVVLLDVFLVILLVLAGFLGYRRGAVLQLFTYGGLLLGLVAGALLVPVTAGAATRPAAQAAIALATLLMAAGIGDLAGWLVGGRVRAATHGTRLRLADSAGGSLVGVTAVMLTIWVLSFNLVNGPFLPVANQIRRSSIVRTIDAVLPEPPAALRDVRRVFNALGFPDLFIGLPPPPADPVRPPSNAAAGRSFRAAEDSTVRVVGEGCGRVQQGSGFVAAEDLVVSNAHVIAGQRLTRVQTGGRTQEAVPVLVDARIDVAVLRVSGSPGGPLPLSGEVVPRGTGGAVVGYPRGGGLEGRNAAVRATIQATGPDIYGDGAVRRRLYELQTRVVPGNSGGPFVLPSGEVAGVVVSASTTDPDVGYAIASTEIAPILERALDRTRRVSTGPCAA
jgi:S1-C subfamily serine protease